MFFYYNQSQTVTKVRHIKLPHIQKIREISTTIQLGRKTFAMCPMYYSIHDKKTLNQVQTLIVRPPSMTLFICSSANDAASGRSYSTNAKPLCLLARASHDKLTFLMGPNGWNACFTVSSRTSKLMPPTYTLFTYQHRRACQHYGCSQISGDFCSLFQSGSSQIQRC